MKNIILFLSALAITFTASATSLNPLTFTTPNNNRLGLNLMQKAFEKNLRENEDGNIMTSPVSYYLALGMAYNGTSGNTRQQLSELIGSTDVESFNQQVVYFQKYLKRAKREKGEGWGAKVPPVLGIANAAWHTTNTPPDGLGRFEFSQNYKDRISEIFNADITGLDFKDAENSAEQMNSWASEKTEGLIQKVMKPDVLKELIWVLMNATYLEANWESPFTAIPAGNGEINRFQTLNGGTVNSDMISQDIYLPLIAGEDGTTSLRLDFYDRGTDPNNLDEVQDDLAFFIVMPNDASRFQKMRQTGQIWTQEFWSATANKLSQKNSYSNVQLVMPKFAFDYSVEMKKDEQITEELGLNFLYQDFTNFSAMATPDSVSSAVGFIKQDTRIELDENGVKAAAVTTIGGIKTTSVQLPPPMMKIDRPFYFAIAAKNSGTLLFLGQVLDPTK